MIRLELSLFAHRDHGGTVCCGGSKCYKKAVYLRFMWGVSRSTLIASQFFPCGFRFRGYERRFLKGVVRVVINFITNSCSKMSELCVRDDDNLFTSVLACFRCFLSVLHELRVNIPHR